MATKFFNNDEGNALFDKFKGIVEGMGEKFHTFLAVSGYFRSSGYFKLRAELRATQRIQVLVGIDIDDVFRKSQRAGMLFFGDPEDAKRQHAKAFSDDIRAAGYTEEIERGILQLCDDVASGKLELRVHSSRDLHAKFYLCLPEDHGPNTDGWVIMGSSNLTDAGLGTTPTPRYELNVAMKDYDDVAWCKAEFDRLWAEGVPITADDIVAARKTTHLGIEPTPFEIFMRVLIDLFGDQVEDGPSMDLPQGVMDLRYQRDAVVQGYQMLCRYDGAFLADVVGLGKTVVATMIAKRFVEANGKGTRILVVHPPAVKQNWIETFKTFGLSRKAQFVSSGSLHKVIEGSDNYRAKEDFDLVIVDESHNFRNSSTKAFGQLQRICKAPRPQGGLVPGARKKVMLLSATPLNNGPQDILNQILLFQDAHRSTIDGVPDIQGYLAPHIATYKRIMAERRDEGEGGASVADVDAMYAKIQKDVLERITIRRTRSNIANEPDYAADLAAQGVSFPKVAPPKEQVYHLDEKLDALFWDTLDQLKEGIAYARYRAIEFLSDPEDAARYGNAAHVAQTLAGVYRTHMVKRLESSFYAFKKSVATFLRITKDMLSMLAQDKVLIIPDLDVTDYLEQGRSLDEILGYARERGLESASFPAAAFAPEFKELLEMDRAILEKMEADWGSVEYDPKFDAFRNILRGEIFSKALNPTGKLVVFSESVDTLEYLKEEMTAALGRSDILLVTAADRDRLSRDIRRSFDANAAEQTDEWNILLASDVLSEGVDLHRANVIVNYDTPWNATRLMQRIGRVNRIGSVAEEIHNYMFYPSKQGNAAIGLYQNAVIKLQGFHSALGEDAKVFSHEEMLRTFTLFDANVKDAVDEQLRYLRIVRELKARDPATYERIKGLPMKCRAVRRGDGERTVVYLASGGLRSCYAVSGGEAVDIGWLEALKLLEASADERSADWTREALTRNYDDVNAALDTWASGPRSPVTEAAPAKPSGNKDTMAALKFLRECRRWATSGALPGDIVPMVDDLHEAIEGGSFVQLTKAVKDMPKDYRSMRSPDDAQRAAMVERISELHGLYCSASYGRVPSPAASPERPEIIISETFSA